MSVGYIFGYVKKKLRQHVRFSESLGRVPQRHSKITATMADIVY